MLYVSSRGDYYGLQSSTYIIDPSTDEVVEELELLQNSDMAVFGDYLYVIAHSWSNVSLDYQTGYAVFDTRDRVTETRNFITDGTEDEITRLTVTFSLLMPRIMSLRAIYTVTGRTVSGNGLRGQVIYPLISYLPANS